MLGGGRSDVGRRAGRAAVLPSMLRRVVAGGAARAGPRPAEAAAAAARDSMRGPLGKSWQLCVRLTPLASHGPHLSLPRAPPTSLARTLLGPCLGVKGRPRRGWQPGPTSRGLRSPFRCPARGGGQGGVGSRGGAGLAWASFSSRAAIWRTLHPRTDNPGSHDALARGTGDGTSGVAAPARVPARPRHPPGSGWQSAKRLNGTEPPASPRPDQPATVSSHPPPSRPQPVTRDSGLHAPLPPPVSGRRGREPRVLLREENI